MPDRPRILFVHAGGRRERLSQLDHGTVMAQEFFYGLPQLRALGFQVDLLETTDLHPDTRSLGYRWAAFKDRRRSRQLAMEHCERLFVSLSLRLQDYDVVIAGTEYVALGLADHIRRMKNPPRLFFFVMGMISKPLLQFAKGSRPLNRALARYRDLLECCGGALFLGRGEYEAVLMCFPDLKDRCHFLPFGVDVDFWTPAAVPPDDYVLFVGNDRRRDVDMLLRIAQLMPDQRFVALTSLLNGCDVPRNLEVTASDWKSQLLSDSEVRGYYQKAAAIVLPIKETWQPSGQSVALQAMACGRPVVISDFSGFWDPGAVRDGGEILIASPNAAEAFVSALSRLRTQPGLAAEIGALARRCVLERYSLTLFASRLAECFSREPAGIGGRAAMQSIASHV
jgi:glycosyltransferase involved in cell wall biosynthesis